jgi:hypothetical protein
MCNILYCEKCGKEVTISSSNLEAKGTVYAIIPLVLKCLRKKLMMITHKHQFGAFSSLNVTTVVMNGKRLGLGQGGS